MGDKRSRFGFIRSKHEHQSIITDTWKDSGGIENYMGEWHTHAEDIPLSSKIGLGLIKEIRLAGSCLFNKVFMIIVGRNSLCVIAYSNLKSCMNGWIGSIYETVYRGK